MSWQLAAFAVLAAAIVAGFAWYERARPDARIIALAGTLAAFAALGRVAFAAVPNVKPTTDIVLLSGYALGAGPGFAIGALAGLSSNFFFGQGPWTPWQMAGWGATGLIGAWVALLAGRRAIHRWPLAVLCAVVGFAFTALQDVGDWVTYSDHSAAQLAVYVGRGLGFDAIHAAGCLVFALAFGPALARSIARFASRLEVTWRPPAPVAPLIVLGLVLGTLVSGGPAARASTTGPGPIAFLLGAQNRDGGLGPARGLPSGQLFSAWAELGLAAAGVDPGRVSRGGRSLTGYLVAGARADGDPGSLERTILALSAAGQTVTDVDGIDLEARLERDVGRDGSVGDQVNLTSFAILALRSARAPVGARTFAWMLAQQDSDGGFGFGTRGGQSDVDDTGAVLEALGGVRSPLAEAARRRAIGFIVRNQDADGGMPSQPGTGSDAQSTAWAVQGLIAAAGRERVIARALAYLDSLIARDGHIAYSRGMDQTPVWVTGQALMALEEKPLPLSPPRPTARSARAAPVTEGVAAHVLEADVAFLEAVTLAPVGLG